MLVFPIVSFFRYSVMDFVVQSYEKSRAEQKIFNLFYAETE